MRSATRVRVSGNRSTLEKLAIELALTAPVKFSKYGDVAYVPRAVINDIRAELDRLGIDWKQIIKNTEKRRLEAAKEQPSEQP